MNRITLLLLFLLVGCMHIFAQSTIVEMPLYEGQVPNSRTVADTEVVNERDNGGRFVNDTAVPVLTAYFPKHPNGKAVIVCPGGGYRGTAIDKEGFLVAESLNADSITAFVLKYRIPNDKTNVEKSLAPLQDAQQAIRHVRSHASEYKVNPDKIGIMGFSAGGHLAAYTSNRFQRMADPNEQDTTSVRPDFSILIYPVISFADDLTHWGSRNNLIGENPTEAEVLLFSADQQVTVDTPPAFLVHAADDKAVPVGNSLAYYQACIEHSVPVEMHLYPKGGHGFGMYNTTTEDVWMERLKNWLKRL